VPKKSQPVDTFTLIVITSVIAIGGIIYELMLSTATSFLIGDATKSYSLGVGLSLFGMGVGSLVAVKLFKNPLKNFMRTELLLSLLGGTSILVLFAAYSLTPFYWLIFVLLSVGIGMLIGFEIPLVMETYKHLKQKQTVFLTRILAADYIGALAGSLLFPFILLPYVGLVRSALIMGLINLSVVVLLLVRSGKRFSGWLRFATFLVMALLAILTAAATTIEQALATRSYQDQVVYYQTTEYQKIILTKRQDDVRLYLNDQLQFSARDEARYHETLVHSAMTKAPHIHNVLVLGGGDGMAAREVLKYSDVESVTLVDIDPAITTLATEQWQLKKLNKGSLADERVQVKNDDATQFIRHASQTYDVIIADLVDPANDRIARLYSTDFYRDIHKKLAKDGVFITQATSSYFTPHAFDIIANNVEQVFGRSTKLSENVPSFGEWGFVSNLPKEAISRRALPPTRFVTDSSLLQAQNVPSDQHGKVSQEVSSILTPTLHFAYNKDMARWSY
jgi:spermidine synthase